MKKVVHEGQAWCSIADAAAYLRTTQPKIRSLIGEGKLEYVQLRVNGRLYVSTAGLAALKHGDGQARPNLG